MATVIFSNSSSGNSSLYLAPTGKFWCAYLLPDGVTAPDATISFEDTPKYQGFYLFAQQTPTDIQTFVSNAWGYFERVKKDYQAGLIVWFQKPDDTPTADNTQLIYLQAQATSAFTLLTSYSYNFGNNFTTLSLTAGVGVIITLDTTNNRFVITGPPSPNFINLSANHIASNTQPDESLEIPLTGDAMAGIRFLVGLNHATDFKAFDTSQKLFFNDATSGELQEMDYPLFQVGSQNDLVFFQASINPLDLLNSDSINTYLAFLGYSKNTSGGAQSDTVMASNFRSDYGLPVNLMPSLNLSTSSGSENIPSDSSSLLIFSERAPADDIDNWYTIPSGYFTLALNAADETYLDTNKQFRLLCGLSGTESISVTAQTASSTGDFLAFKGEQPAYAPQFPITNSGFVVGSNTNQEWLSTIYVTAWAGIVIGDTANAATVYHSQPQGSSLYAPNQGNVEQASGFLGYFLANSGTLSNATNTLYFPMASYGSNTVIPNKVSASLFELQILTPTRKNNIANDLKEQAHTLTTTRRATQTKAVTESADLSLTDSVVQSTSPQGFYLEVDSDTGVWDKMQLASNQFLKSDGTESDVFTLAFDNLGATLQSAFQTNQLFLVVSYNPNNVLGDFLHLMEIEEWPFQLQVPTESKPGQYSNVLIFKFCDQSLQERVQNIQYWTMPNDFNDTSESGLPNVSSWLDDYIQKGIDKYSQQNDNDYYKFYQVATDPNWTGVIALKVDISLANFPTELQGLLAGIDLADFNAHHFGINLSVVQNDKGALSMKPTSSMFGLIDYEDSVFQAYNSNVDDYKTSAPINTSVDYVYTVLLLKVLFENSKIKNFNSYIAFTLNKLFGESVQSVNRDNLLILDGSYENHNGVPSYTFNVNGDNLLNLDSQIIQDVEILKSSFVTLITQDGSGTVVSRFSFFGYINFYALKGMDILSFGNEDGSTPNGCGVSFSNMYIDLSFPLETPTSQTFIFDIGSITFDLGASYARDKSLYQHFPLQLTGLVSGTSSNDPASQGYLNLALPGLEQQQAINGDWFGLTFKLNMGTLGALASAAGFNTTFMIPWNVGGSGATAGLKLPGVNPQAPSLSLQGVIKMDIGSLSLNIADDGVSYLMKINDIALKVLSLTFPPGATIGFFLFGNPSSTAPPESLGWYGSYVKK